MQEPFHFVQFYKIFLYGSFPLLLSHRPLFCALPANGRITLFKTLQHCNAREGLILQAYQFAGSFPPPGRPITAPGTALSVKIAKIRIPAEIGISFALIRKRTETRRLSQGIYVNQGKTKSILIADNEEAIRDSLGMVLRDEGYTCKSVRDGNEALQAIQSEPYDLVILDLYIPGRSGIEVMRKLNRKKAEIPVLVMSSYFDWDIAAEAMQLGALHYLTKPVDFEELIRYLDNYFAGTEHH